ncbi:MAG: DUF6134 family protein [Tistlia sp.]|uniref:DUF6134 family protein n=1 Tax=Tistlia sp. TaxID=3057121 RepID=UPI0034A4EEA0
MTVNAESTVTRLRRPRTAAAARVAGRDGGLPRRALLALVPALLLAGLGRARAADQTSLQFEVFRGQDSVGDHSITFLRDGERLQVETRTEVQLELIGVPVYTYTHQGREVWQGPYLQSLETQTNDDGTSHRVSGRRTDQGFSVEGSAGSFVVSAGVIPGSYWNSDLIETNALIDVETGELFEIVVEDRGYDIVKAADEEVRARRFRVTGERIAHLWYDASGLIVKMAFETRGEYIEHRLRRIV